jgi:Alpha-L-arabinofuranosidase
MKKHILLAILLSFNFALFANMPDSLYIKAFSTDKNNNKNGLHIAYSTDKKTWQTIGNEFSFLKSDYANWGSEKRMFNPGLYQNNGKWICEFSVNEYGGIVGTASSSDLILWKPQEYAIHSVRVEFDNIFKVPRAFVENLLNHVKITAYNNLLYAETTSQDGERFANLENVQVKITPDFSNTKKISDLLIGAFFEDINYAADGGLYAELIQNRDFEYSSADRKEWNSTSFWTIENGEFRIDTVNPIHKNNPHYVILKNGEILTNEGFDGIAVSAGEKYDFSVFARSEKSGKISVKLVDDKENVISNEILININSKNWKKFNADFTVNKTVNNAKLKLKSLSDSRLSVDMISLFPQKTFKNRKNGLRADLAQTIADLKPRFVRFPGGCVAHGNGIENMFDWKNSIGKLEERKPDFNLWGYHQTKGLGYFEYFQFCEDIGAEPMPIIAAGVPCQNSRHQSSCGIAGQQCGIPLDEMDDYIQDILDLIEWANGDKSTKWGKIRAASGHPKPFNLKYIGIGNEDLISEVFKERFQMIFEKINEKHPEIVVIGTVGPFYEGSDYEFGWDFASEIGVPIVDEHYYVPPAWMIYNQNYYDNYDRNKPKVYLGEYAAHLPNRHNNLETALAEALHLCNVERNGDIVLMTSYAPLLAKDGRTQWNPDLIYFNNTEVKPTPGYYVQKLFGQNAGNEYIPSSKEFSVNDEKARVRVAHSIVKDNKTGDYIVRMVNLLPKEVEFEFQDFELQNKKIEKTTLTGNPADRTIKPVYEIIDLQENKIILQAYSFTILRVSSRK